MTRIGRWLDSHICVKKRRSFRVFTAIFAIVLFHISDLYMTLQYRGLNLMIESNQIARVVIYEVSPLPLIFYKTVLTLIGCSLLIRYKDRISAEIACWFILSILIIVIAKWTLYMDAITVLHPTLPIDEESLKEFIENL